ncbi:hypothetical protein K466DRAFT_498039, partial [Polyporus arcularius HHB13444]
RRFRDAVTSGHVKIDHRDNPNFLYPEGGFDPNNLFSGLLQGETLKQALCAIMTSPSSITEPPGKKTMGRGCIAHIYKIDSVTPSNIAYVATLWRNVLSSCSQWQANDGEFNGPAFFKRIVEMFDHKGDLLKKEWADETLAWWNAYNLPLTFEFSR